MLWGSLYIDWNLHWTHSMSKCLALKHQDPIQMNTLASWRLFPFYVRSVRWDFSHSEWSGVKYPTPRHSMHHNATYLESIEISHHTKTTHPGVLEYPEQSGAIWSNPEHLEPPALEPGASPSSKLATTNSPPSGRPQRRLGEVAGKSAGKSWICPWQDQNSAYQWQMIKYIKD